MEKILIFHLNESELKKLKQIAGTLKIHYEIVDESHFMQPIENLLSGHPSPLIAPFTGELPEESLVLLCDFTEKRMDKLLLALRRDKIMIDYKAVLTPTNRKWNAMRLFLEMRAEKAAYQNR